MFNVNYIKDPLPLSRGDAMEEPRWSDFHNFEIGVKPLGCSKISLNWRILDGKSRTGAAILLKEGLLWVAEPR